MKFSIGFARAAALFLLVSGLALAGNAMLRTERKPLRTHSHQCVQPSRIKFSITRPSVVLTSPANGASFSASSPIPLSASASPGTDSYGCPVGITEVDFYDGSVQIATTTDPYSYTWTNATVGTHTLKAIVVGDNGSTNTSSLVTITVTAATNAPPSVTLTSPADGATATAPGTFNLAANASDSDGTVAKVEFYNGSTLLATATASPYSYTWSGIPAGSYSLTAKAYDNVGAATTSATATVQVGSGSPPPPPPPPPSTTGPDLLSDSVGATAGQFRVDESGAATYSIPIFTPPGITGVVPKVALSYSSQGGDGPTGKGWSVAGLSGITRCRATREAGDFIVGGQPVDGDPQPINFTASDRFCLDGQRLIPAPTTAAACATVAGATATQFRGEIDSQQRVCGYSFDTTGPRFFTVERKDGSTSWFGDRRDSTGAAAGAYPNGVLAGTGGVLSWALTRFQDSTGNYIDYSYALNPAGTSYPGEQHVSRIAWTGKNVLPGQSGNPQSPYQWIDFNYSSLPTAEFARGYASGSPYWQTQRLDSITVSAESKAVRHYALTYQYSMASPHARVLSQLQECTDPTMATCLAPTTFSNSAGQTSFSTTENSNLDFSGMLSYKLGDVDGDGRQDIVWVRNVNDSTCSKSRVYVSYSQLDASGNLTFYTPQQTGYCVPLDMAQIGTKWKVFDYDGDGREDIMIPTGSSTWAVYRSNGRPDANGVVFDSSNNLVGGLSPAISSDAIPDLADLNGDGQLDAIYQSSTGAMAARIAERHVDGTWGWGAERAIVAAAAAQGDPCNVTDINGDPVWCGYNSYSDKTGRMHLNDFNGDGRADVLMNVSVQEPSGSPACTGRSPTRRGAHSGPRRMLGANTIQLPINGSCTVNLEYLEVMTVQQITATTVTMMPGQAWKTRQDLTTFITDFKFGDFNGDGLTDVLVDWTSPFYGTPGLWQPMLNDGTGHFLGYQSGFTLPNETYVQLNDVNGDGRADIVYPAASGGTYCTYAAMLAQPDGSFAAESGLPGGQAQACGNNDLTSKPWAQIFADFDGDGAVDYALLRLDAAGAHISRAPTGSRFQPRDVVQTITNGNGAITRMLYTPLTNAAIYRPDNNSRNTLSYGRGSPVIDLLAPMYAVGYVESSAPVFGNPNALSYVYYRYAGAKMQAGGRGFLGFREITTVDANHPGQFVATTTDYQQNFPFIGSPLSTAKTVVSGAYAPPTCLTGVNSADASGNACFLPPGNPFTAFTGANVAQNTQIWEASPAFDPTVQQPLQVRTAGTEEKLRDLSTAATTSDVWTSFAYDTFGNVTGSTVDTYSDDHTTRIASVVTANTYVNNEAWWRLGRLMTSTVTHTRGSSSIARSTSFTYDMSSPAMTGLLLSERIQPGGSADQDRRTVYTLDAYGNRLSTTTCTADVASCSPSGLNFHPVGATGPSQTVQRYSRVAYDSNGRYPVTTSEPFWNGTGSAEVVTQQVLARSALGDVLQAVNAQGVNTLAVPGAFGRPYYAWAETVANATPGDPAGGAESWTTYRWCGTGTNQVTCPKGAVFRQRSVAKGAPSKWTYFDVLGRPLLAVGQTFNTGVAQQEFAGVCTYSDAVGQAERTSNPFFLSDAASGGEPSFATQTDPCGSRNWALTKYDVLGRPLQVTFADGTTVSSTYAGLTTTSTDQLGHQTVVTKNAVGEKTSVTDSANLTTSYAYDGAGDLLSVTRNGGRGNIVTSYVYDTLGRKLSQTDGDTGTYSYAYNAAGELLRQTDAKGQRIESDVDARGRVWRKIAYTTAGAVESTSLFNFDADPGAPGPQTLGALVSESVANNITASDTMSRNYSYDTLGRPSGKSYTIDGNTYTEAVLYDTLGRVQESKDATSHWLRTQYAANGFVQRQCEGDGSNTNACTGAASSIYIQTNVTDNWGHVVSENRGPVATTRSYDPYNGRLQTICSGVSCALQNETYTWDNKGNLLSRSRGTTYTEKFQYDANDRVTLGWYSVLNGTSYSMPVTPATDVNVTEWMSYDPLGNICRRMVPGGATNTYTYAKLGGCGLSGLPGGVNAGSTANSGYQLLKFGTENYTTDANGSMTVATNIGTVLRGWNYDTQNRAVEVYKGATPAAATLRTRWDYDASGARFRRTDDGSAAPNGLTTTLYLGNVERVTTGASVSWRRTIAGVAVMALVGTNPSLPTTNFLLHDHIGSVVAVANSSGALVERGDYSAFGGMRTAIDGVSVGLAALSTTTRGFTGHEQLGSLDLIHMNGRIYDPALGRFLQADPMVAEPGNPQNWNPYSYVFNNPLVNTDPTGMFSLRSFFQWAPRILNVLAAFFPVFVIPAIIVSAAATTYSEITGGVRAVFSNVLNVVCDELLGNLPGSMVAGGIMSESEGRGFWVGARNGAEGALEGAAENFVVEQIQGYCDSQQTGGKFDNGAGSGAANQAMNEEQSNNIRDVSVSGDQQSHFCPGDGGANPVTVVLATKTNAPILVGLAEAHGNIEYDNNLLTPIPGAMGEDGKPLMPMTDEPVTVNSHFGSNMLPDKKEGYISEDMHYHPPANVSIKVTKADNAFNPALKVGDDRTPLYGFSKTDMDSYISLHSNGWVVQGGTNKVLYYPVQNNPTNCHYEFDYK